VAFTFYDVETTGLNKRFDQILQFAALRTDVDLIETDRFETRSRLMPQVIPSPKALHLTGTSLADATDASRQSHYDMVCEIATVLSSSVEGAANPAFTMVKSCLAWATEQRNGTKPFVCAQNRRSEMRGQRFACGHSSPSPSRSPAAGRHSRTLPH
jgi:hypothetical protein